MLFYLIIFYLNFVQEASACRINVKQLVVRISILYRPTFRISRLIENTD